MPCSKYKNDIRSPTPPIANRDTGKLPRGQFDQHVAQVSRGQHIQDVNPLNRDQSIQAGAQLPHGQHNVEREEDIWSPLFNDPVNI